MSQIVEMPSLVIQDQKPTYPLPPGQANNQNAQTAQNAGAHSHTHHHQVQDILEIRDKFPPDVKMAKGHGKAHRIAKPIEDLNILIETCPCCGMPQNNKSLRLCCSITELSFLGTGLPMFFRLMIGCLWLIFATLAVYGIYALVSNSVVKPCIESLDKCEESFITLISLPNGARNEKIVIIQAWLNFACICVLIIAMQFLRKQQRQLDVDIDRENVSPSDFTAYLNNLPENYDEKQIRAMIQDWWKMQDRSSEEQSQEYGIWGVNIAYDITDYADKLKLDQELSLKIRQLKSQQEKKEDWDEQKEAELAQLMKSKTQNKADIDRLEADVTNHNYKKVSPVAFVTFNERRQLERLLESQELSAFQRFILRVRLVFGKATMRNALFLEQNHIQIKRAPEPSDVIWENCAVSKCKKYSARVFSHFITIVLLAISFVLIYAVNVGQDYLQKQFTRLDSELTSTEKAQQQALSIASSIIITIVNIVMTITIRALSSMEKHNMQTKLITSLATKFSLAIFVNTALIPLAVAFTIKQEYIWKNAGLISDIFWIMVIQAVSVPCTLIIDITYAYRLYMRSKIEKGEGTNLMTQGEANQWFEGQPFDLATQYAQIIKIMWMAGFYIPLEPILLPIAFGSIVFLYMANKYILLRRCSRPSLLSSQLHKEMMEMLEYFPLSIAVGSWFFQHQFLKRTILPHFLGVIISSTNFIFPSNKLNKVLCKIDEDVQMKENYDQVRYTFEEEYGRCNPITQDEEIRKWNQYLKDHKQEHGNDDRKKKHKHRPVNPLNVQQNLLASRISSAKQGVLGVQIIPNPIKDDPQPVHLLAQSPPTNPLPQVSGYQPPNLMQEQIPSIQHQGIGNGALPSLGPGAKQTLAAVNTNAARNLQYPDLSHNPGGQGSTPVNPLR